MKTLTLCLTTLAAAQIHAATQDAHCAPTPPAACNPDSCCRTYCVGPDNYAVNAPVNPVTCNGDWVVEVAGFYWKPYQENMEYAVYNEVTEEAWVAGFDYINANFENPNFKWDFGFKLGIGYNTTCDGWDFGVNWTRFSGGANGKREAETEDNAILYSFWSNGSLGAGLIETEISVNWDLDLDLVDVELGREFWTGKRLAFRPFIGLRYASIDQDYTQVLRYKEQFAEYNTIKHRNDFTGFGARIGFDTSWILGCGFGFYSNLGTSILVGRHRLHNTETNRLLTAPFTKNKFTEAYDSFKVGRFIADLGLGVEWSSLFCDCEYGLTVSLGWEGHLFLNQNQMWKLNNRGPSATLGVPINVVQIDKVRGDLLTQGWTLAVKFEF